VTPGVRAQAARDVSAPGGARRMTTLDRSVADASAPGRARQMMTLDRSVADAAPRPAPEPLR